MNLVAGLSTGDIWNNTNTVFSFLGPVVVFLVGLLLSLFIAYKFISFLRKKQMQYDRDFPQPYDVDDDYEDDYPDDDY